MAEAAPWGQQFPEPLFDGPFVLLEKRVVGAAHLRMRLRPFGGSVSLNAIAFGAADEPWVRSAGAIHAAYRLSVNDYRGTRSLQLIVEYAREIDAEA